MKIDKPESLIRRFRRLIIRSSSSLWFALASAVSRVNEQIRESESRGFRANKRSKNAVVQACLVRSAFSLRSLWRVAGALFHAGVCAFAQHIYVGCIGVTG